MPSTGRGPAPRGLERGEDLFDPVDVRAVGRQEVDVGLSFGPGKAASLYIATALVGCVRAFFTRHAVPLKKPGDDAGRWTIEHRPTQPASNLRQGEKRRYLDPSQYQVTVLIDPVRAMIAAALIGFKITARMGAHQMG